MTLETPLSIARIAPGDLGLAATPPRGRPLVHQGKTPIVWLILADKSGDNAQALAVAEALPWPFEVRKMTMQARYALGKPKVEASLAHIDAACSDALQAPWPDLVIAIGRRMSNVALWIKQLSGGTARIVLLGAAKGRIRDFDLTVVSDQYRYSPRANMLRIRYPLQRIDRARIASEADEWRPEIAVLPRPLIAVMVGGLTKEVKFDAAIAETFGLALGRLAHESAGSLIVTTSRRTPPDVIAALKRNLPQETPIHEWSPAGGRNPYRALLSLADRFVVTSDSLSMQMEIARLGRPLAIYRLPPGSVLAAGALSRLADGILGSRLFGSALARRGEQRIGVLLDRLGSLRHHRDILAIPRRLVADGHAVWFGQPFSLDPAPPPDELPEVVSRITALLEERAQGGQRRG